jgi:hypothetical protein
MTHGKPAHTIHSIEHDECNDEKVAIGRGAGGLDSNGLNVREDYASATAPDVPYRQPVRDASLKVSPNLPGKITEVIQTAKPIAGADHG